MRPHRRAWFRNCVVQVMRAIRSIFSILLVLVLTGCYARTWSYTIHSDATVGEEHEVNFPPDQALQLTADVLRGEGILFEVLPDNSIQTLWKNADNPPGFLSSLAGAKPRYRYEITATPEGGSRSKIIVNVRTEYVPDNEVDSYKASHRFNMFSKLDTLAATLPPSQRTPTAGGVNFALLPHEDLRGLAKRVTGDPENWKTIAQANGLSSPTDVSPLQTIWVPNLLLKNKPASSASSPP